MATQDEGLPLDGTDAGLITLAERFGQTEIEGSMTSASPLFQPPMSTLSHFSSNNA